MFIPLLSLLPPSFFKAAKGLDQPGMDKVVHACIYGLQTILLVAAWRSWKGSCGRSTLLYGALTAAAYGLFMEVLQRTLTECRTFSWGDAAANLAGALVAAAFVAAWFCRKPK